MKRSQGQQDGIVSIWAKRRALQKGAYMAADRSKWSRTSSEVITLSGEAVRDFAKKYSTLPKSPTERVSDPKRMERLRAVIEMGKMIPFFWSDVLYEGVVYRLNGQHSSSVLADPSVNPDLLKDVTFHVDHYQASSAADMGDIFRQFDARWSARSVADVAGAFQGLNPTIANCDRKRAKLAMDGIAWYSYQVVGTYVPPGDGVYEFFFNAQYWPFVLFCDQLFAGKTKELKHKAIVGAMFETFALKNEAEAVKFWNEVARGSNDGDDTRQSAVLSRELQEIDDRKATKKTKPGEYYLKAIKAWNAYRKGEILASLKVDIKKEWPEVVA